MVGARTPYPEVYAPPRQLLGEVRERLGRHFVGMYLYGPLAAGDFAPDSSDIDFLVVAGGDLTGELSQPLRGMHASPGYRRYAIVTMCRMLYTFRHGAVVSKPEAARWELGALDARWHELIRQAMAWPGVPLPDNLEDTLDLIRHTSEAGETLPAGPD